MSHPRFTREELWRAYKRNYAGFRRLAAWLGARPSVDDVHRRVSLPEAWPPPRYEREE